MDQNQCKNVISRLRQLRNALDSENFSGFYRLYPELKRDLAQLRDLEMKRSIVRYAIGYIHDAFAYNPSYQLTVPQVEVIIECLTTTLVLSHTGSLNTDNLDSIRAYIEAADLYLLPIGKSPIDRVGVEETYEGILKDLNLLEKRLASILDIPIEDLPTELVRRLKADELGEYDYCGLPAAWLEIRSAKIDWESDNESK